MRIAIFGATSELAKDLILSFAKNNMHSLALFARRPEAVEQWLTRVKLPNKYDVLSFDNLQTTDAFDAIINFVGAGNPAKTAALGSSIFDITQKYDDLALQYLEAHPACKYIFMSSGAAYCSSFEEPADENTKSHIGINHLKPQDWYGIAKLYAECRHRALPKQSIIDIRVFNYFSHTQDMAARYLITDIIRAIKNKMELETSSNFMMRDYLHPADFYQLVELILTSHACNTSVDCYSQSPINKLHLLKIMREEFGLICNVTAEDQDVKAMRDKSNYFSKNKKAFHVFKYYPAYSSESALVEQAHMFFKI
jgi:nucleoside-diphosphate-sugar epimerase